MRPFLIGIFLLTVAPPAFATCKNINWGPCEDALTALANGTIECATLSVPLDYTRPSSDELLTLELARVPAAKVSKGSIILNFGGPGVVNRPALAGVADSYPLLVSDEHDLVTFDSRGTGNTLPFRCFDTEEERALFEFREPDIWSTLQLPTIWSNASDAELGRRWAAGTAISERCFRNAEKIGDLLGTAFVARDMMQIVDALNEDGMLRYFGQSYGTVLGATTAAMFPDRIDRMVIDGVLNPREYFNTFEFELLDSADTAFEAFFESCVENPTICALAATNTSVNAEELQQTFYNFLYELKFNPISFNDTLIDYQLIKTGILSALYIPTVTFPAMADGLAALMTGDLASFSSTWNTLVAGFPGASNEQLAAIRCADRSVRVDSLAELMPVVEKKYALSKVFGDLLPVLDAVCSQWKFHAKERYEGFFDEETNFPLLVIGNLADAQTPLASARNVSESFPNAVLLQSNGIGHTSLSHPSICTINATRAYFINGTLPEPGTVCEPVVPLFTESAV